jgi:hypothetical protein
LLFSQIEWNSVPFQVVCAFPYILAVTQEAVEFRYAVNGSLLQTLCMPELKLITSKVNFIFQSILITTKYRYRECHGFILTNRDDYFWVDFDHFWIEKYFARQLWGSIENWLEPKTETPSEKLAWPKSLKCSVVAKR